VRIVEVIEDDEARVDWYRTAWSRNFDGPGMAAKARVRFKEHDIMALREQPSRTEPGNTPTDNRDPQPFHVPALRLNLL
jgi:hypothetical protein